MGLRVATLVNLSFLGMDKLEERLSRFLAPAATARCIPEAVKHLRGMLALEIGHDQAEALRELLAAHNYQDIRVVCDYQERNRFVFAFYG
jgi:methylase of polypeptide subunit release factors